MMPKWLSPMDDEALFNEIKHSTTPITLQSSVDKQTSLNGYTPKNKKLLGS